MGAVILPTPPSMILSLLVIASSVTGYILQDNCDEFYAEACPITEDTLLDGGFKHTDTASQCQDICRTLSECAYFTWFDRQCFLLNSCEFTENCKCCISGPGLEDSENVDTCIQGCSPTTTTSVTSPTTSTPTTSTTPTTPTTGTTKTTSTTKITTPSTTITTPTTTAPSTCGPGWQDLSTSCYSLISNHTNLADCSYACYAQGGMLASVHTRAENDFLKEMLVASNKTIAWLGGVFQDGHFSWLDHSYVNYMNWAEGQPDHHEWGDCVGLGLEWGVKPGQWDDVMCLEHLEEACICKKEILNIH